MNTENNKKSPPPDPEYPVPSTQSPVPGTQFPVPDPDIAISVRNLSKKYRLYDSPQHRLKEALHPFRKKFHREFWALRDISFEVRKGDCIGIIGKNGSGKSTLLQIICGVLRQSQGEIAVNGRISALLELGAGFNPEFTGKQNVYMNGALLGFGKDEMDARFPMIAEFAEIGAFIDQPVKTYSSGMYVRLAFSAAIHVDPEILIIDEALAVGDVFFQAKCAIRIQQLIEKGITLLIVSHDMNSIKSLCNKVILVNEGIIFAMGTTFDVVQAYLNLNIEENKRYLPIRTGKHQTNVKNFNLPSYSKDLFERIVAKKTIFTEKGNYQRIKNGKAHFLNVLLLDENGQEISHVEYGQKVTLKMALETLESIDTLGFGYCIKNQRGLNVIYSDSHIEGKNLYNLKRGEKYVVTWTFSSMLMHGDYTIGCVLSIPVDLSKSLVDFCDFVPIACQFIQSLRSGSRLYGEVHWENNVEVAGFIDD
jgi:lipopolysaccharide transport system ATP-binding protein